MKTNKTDNSMLQYEVSSKRKHNQPNSKSLKIKNMLLAMMIFLISSVTYAQMNQQNNSQNQNVKNKSPQSKSYSQNSDVHNKPDGYMMHNGSMVKIVNGKITPMEEDVTLSNGTMIMKNGSCMKKNGNQTMLKEGEHIDMTGKMIPMHTSNNYNKSKMDKSSKKDTMYWKNNKMKDKQRKN